MTETARAYVATASNARSAPAAFKRHVPLGLKAVILNKTMSLVVVASALPSRAATVPFSTVAAHWPIIVNLLAGSLIGAWFGGSWATRVASQTLYRVIAALLMVIAVILVIGHGVSASGALLLGPAQIASGVAARFRDRGGGCSARCCRGRLLFGADIKLAGRLSLAVSLPTMLVGLRQLQSESEFCRSWREPPLCAPDGRRVYRGVIGGWLLGLVPNSVLQPLLAVILVLSALKVRRHK